MEGGGGGAIEKNYAIIFLSNPVPHGVSHLMWLGLSLGRRKQPENESICRAFQISFLLACRLGLASSKPPLASSFRFPQRFSGNNLESLEIL